MQENEGIDTIIDNEKKLDYLQWELDRRKADIRSFETRLITALGIDSVLVGILSTFYSINPEINLSEKILLILFGVLLLIILFIQFYLWWPRRASEKPRERKLEERPDIDDLNSQLNILEKTLKIRANLVYIALCCFLTQIITLLIMLFINLC